MVFSLKLRCCMVHMAIYNGYIVLENLRLEDVFPFKMASLKVAVDLPWLFG